VLLIRRILMCLGRPDPHPDPLVTNADPVPAPDPDPSIIRRNSKKNVDLNSSVTSL
jgi:hypothetical protein